MTTLPGVSVVIPTRARPELVVRAVRSALGQSDPDLDVVVAVDGPDPDTEAALAAIPDPRLRVVVSARSEGAGAARNRGVEAATGRWIAFLDDDDEWLPTKLERQLAAMEASGLPRPIGACAIIVRGPTGDRAWRQRLPGPREPLSEYLFVRRTPWHGEGTVGTSTIVAPRELLLEVPFDPTVRRFQDADWLLRAAAAGAELVFVDAQLSIWTAPEGRSTITAAHAVDWRHAYDWIVARRQLVTPRAYAAFLLVRVAALAAVAGDRSAIRTLWREARRRGRPGVFDVVLFAGRWVIPDALRTFLRRRLAAVSTTTAAE